MSLDMCAHITTIKVLQTYLDSQKFPCILLWFCAVVRAHKENESEKMRFIFTILKCTLSYF